MNMNLPEPKNEHEFTGIKKLRWIYQKQKIKINLPEAKNEYEITRSVKMKMNLPETKNEDEFTGSKK